MSDIFVSYSGRDRDRVLPLVNAFEKKGWSVFWDRTIPAGKTWREIVGTEIQACGIVVVVWTENSVKSEWVLEEAETGKRRKRLIPVLLDVVEIPFGFGNIQAANLIAWDGNDSLGIFQRLVEDVSSILGPLPGVRSTEELPRLEAETQRKAEQVRFKQENASKQRRPLKKGLWRAIILIISAGILSALIVHVATFAILNEHFSKVILGVFLFGVGTIISLFISKTGGLRIPKRDLVKLRAPAGVGALLFVLAAELWWVDWSKGEQLIGQLAAICEKRNEFVEASEEKIKMELKVQQVAEAIDKLWFKSKQVQVLAPCSS